MLLYLIRHGIAIDRNDPDCPAEKDRPLTSDGRKKTKQSAVGLRILGVRARLWVSSPYLRALQTAEITAEALGYPPKKILTTDALLPNKRPLQLLQILAQHKANEVICFGHAPHLDEVIAYILGWRHAKTKLKKSGAVALELSSFISPRGRLLWLMPSKALRMIHPPGSGRD